MDPIRARLRLELSDGEIQCPKKLGQAIAMGRCLILQDADSCTCDTFRRAAGLHLRHLSARRGAAPFTTTPAGSAGANPNRCTQGASDEELQEVR